MKDRELKELFGAHRADIPDEGFSRRVRGMLPARRSLMPRMVMVAVIALGLGLWFAVGSLDFVLGQIGNLIRSIDLRQVPPADAIATCLGITALMGFIGYSAMRVGEGS